MKVYINASIEPLPEEDDLIGRLAFLGQDDQRSPHSWTGLCNARHELRIILECFSATQDSRLTEWLHGSGLFSEVQGGFTAKGLFADKVECLDRAFAPKFH